MRVAEARKAASLTSPRMPPAPPARATVHVREADGSPYATKPLSRGKGPARGMRTCALVCVAGEGGVTTAWDPWPLGRRALRVSVCIFTCMNSVVPCGRSRGSCFDEGYPLCTAAGLLPTCWCPTHGPCRVAAFVTERCPWSSRPWCGCADRVLCVGAVAQASSGGRGCACMGPASLQVFLPLRPPPLWRVQHKCPSGTRVSPHNGWRVSVVLVRQRACAACPVGCCWPGICGTIAPLTSFITSASYFSQGKHAMNCGTISARLSFALLQRSQVYTVLHGDQGCTQCTVMHGGGFHLHTLRERLERSVAMRLQRPCSHFAHLRFGDREMAMWAVEFPLRIAALRGALGRCAPPH